jgi:ribosomal protein S18 acetylase RimI-like enzyme
MMGHVKTDRGAMDQAVGNTGVTVRRLTGDDAAAYRSFRLQALASDPPAFSTLHAEAQALPLSWYATRLAPKADDPGFILGAFDGSNLIGTTGLEVFPRTSERHKANLFGMAVHPDHRRRGIGRALLAAALAEARAIPGVRQVILSVSRGNKSAEKLYRTFGFETYGVEPRANVIAGAAIDKLLMILKSD